MATDARVETDAFDDLARIEASELGIGIELVEKGNPQGEVGVGEELDRFGFSRVSEQDRHVLLDCAFQKQVGKDSRPFGLFADDDA